MHELFKNVINGDIFFTFYQLPYILSLHSFVCYVRKTLDFYKLCLKFRPKEDYPTATIERQVKKRKCEKGHTLCYYLFPCFGAFRLSYIYYYRQAPGLPPYGKKIKLKALYCLWSPDSETLNYIIIMDKKHGYQILIKTDNTVNHYANVWYTYQ